MLLPKSAASATERFEHIDIPMDQQIFSLSLAGLTAIAAWGGGYLNHRWQIQRDKNATVYNTKREQIEKAYRHIIELRKVVFVVGEFLHSTQFKHGDKLEDVSVSYQKMITNIEEIKQNFRNIVIRLNASIQECKSATQEIEQIVENVEMFVNNAEKNFIAKNYDLGSESLLIGDLYVPELRSHFKVLLGLYLRLQLATLAYIDNILDCIRNDGAAIRSDAQSTVEDAIKKFRDHTLTTIDIMSKSIM
jgi:hypothetical protein